MAFFNLENADMTFKYIFYYYFISHVSKQCIPFATSAFSVTGLTIGTILKMIFENQGLSQDRNQFRDQIVGPKCRDQKCIFAYSKYGSICACFIFIIFACFILHLRHDLEKLKSMLSFQLKQVWGGILGPKWANALFAQNIQHYAPFSKLIREMPLFCNLIFSKSSFNVKLNLQKIEYRAIKL